MLQAIPLCEDTASQTDWRYPRNAATQYYPRDFSQEEKDEIEQKEEYMEFINNVVPRSVYIWQLKHTVWPRHQCKERNIKEESRMNLEHF